jgi:Uma2 family endonuclease
MSTALHLTVAEFDRMALTGAFDQLDRKIELIRGELREMNPPGPIHVDLVSYLTNWSVRSTDPSQIRVSVQNTMDLAEQVSRPEPDLLWIRAGRYRDRLPAATDTLLAIEVAYSSLKFDQGEKAELYAEAGIVEYWIVDAVGECVHVFRAPSGRQFLDRSVARRGQTISPLCCPTAVLDLEDMFAGE